jgi:hypothetical protein
MPLERKLLDTASLQAAYTRQELPVSEQFGTGERYTFGTTHVDIYPLPPETTPLLFVRGRRNRLAVGDVYKVEPTEQDGMHVLYVDGEIVVNPNGNYVTVYTAPDPDLLGMQEASSGQKRKDRRGTEYTQTMIETTGTKEGERVEVWGVLKAAPQSVNKSRNSPLQFLLGVDRPEKEGETDFWEVYATNKVKQQIRAKKLGKDDRIHAVLYRHSWTVNLQDGRETIHTRYNLATIIAVEKKGEGSSSKRNTDTALIE